MSDSQKWRPPVAPKPSLKVPLAQQRDISPALRGATFAFSPPVNGAGLPATSQAPTTKSGALGAATFAERHKREQDQRNSQDIRISRSPVRGRPQLAAQGTGERNVASRNPLERTASQIAAKAANANNSPSRTPTIAKRHDRPIIPPRSSSRESRSSRSQHTHDQSLIDDEKPFEPTVVKSPLRDPPAKVQLNLKNVPTLERPAAFDNQFRKVDSKPESRSFLPAVNAALISRGAVPPSPPPSRKPMRKGGEAHDDKTKGLTGSTANTRPAMSGEESQAPEPVLRASLPVPVPQRRTGTTSPRAEERSPRSHQGSISVNNLADAIVASSLASSRQGSRAASPTKHQHPPSFSRRRSRSIDFLRAQKTGEKQPPLKPLNQKPMRQTMRKQSPEHESEDETKRGRRHMIRKHPNKHHEGARKRWRDKVTERERKRYEGVWASNRGILHDYETDTVRRKWPHDVNSDDLVLNVVVREVWSRSRLPSYALEEVWDLVAITGNERALNRDQFVVGLWLVDQRLKGRKLPVKVSPSVWTSARSVSIKVKSKPF